jgi:hypothetical protein
MAKKKIYKKGTKVIIHTSCNYAGCDNEQEYILDRNMTEDELNSLAGDIALEDVSPEGSFSLPEDE